MGNTLNTFLSAVGSFGEFSDALKSLWSEWWKLLSSLIGIAFLVYGVAMAVTFMGAGEDEAKAKRAKRLAVWYTIALIGVFVVIVGVPMIFAGMSDWAEQQGGLLAVMFI